MNFDDFLKELGYEDSNQIDTNSEKDSLRFLFDMNGKKLCILPFVMPYPNKKSFLYREYANLIYQMKNDEFIKKRMINTIENIHYPKPGRVFEVGWDVEFNCDPYSFTAKERTQILFQSFKVFKSILSKGEHKDYSKQIGDVVTSQPFGIKFDLGFTDDSKNKGVIQRSNISKRFYFGDIKEDGMQYYMYDENLNICPI